MERRADPGSGVDEAREDSKAWQAVRRALGRLVSRVGVRAVEDAERVIPVPAAAAATGVAAAPSLTR